MPEICLFMKLFYEYELFYRVKKRLQKGAVVIVGIVINNSNSISTF